MRREIEPFNRHRRAAHVAREPFQLLSLLGFHANPGVQFSGLDEYVTVDEIAGTPDTDLFVETTRWFGVRLRLQAGNVFDRRFERDRLVWNGPREQTPFLFGESRSRTRGYSLELSATGNF